MTGISQGLAYLHERGVVHSDIKSVRDIWLLNQIALYANINQDNVLVSSSGDALICDFGCSRMITASQSLAKVSSGLKGTPRYQAYELLSEGGFKGYTKEADVWAFGMTVYVSTFITLMILHTLSYRLEGTPCATETVF